MNKITIEGKTISASNPAYIIAEIGFNHGGDVSLAASMIEAAARSGADAVKFQTFVAEKLVLDNVEHFGIIKNCELSPEAHLQLAQIAKTNGVSFISTPFDSDAVTTLERAQVPAYKVASMDITNHQLLKVIAQTGKPIILSTGMASVSEVAEAVETITGQGNQQIALLHCVSKYPTEPKDADLQVIPYLRDIFNRPVGWSDHVLGNAVALAAVAVGARVVEKHFTIDKNLPGPDHALSSDPSELSKLVADIRSIESALLPVSNLSTRSDRDNARLFRRGIYAACQISEGEIITAEMVRCLRPETELSPRALDLVIGRRAQRSIDRNQAISLDDL